LDEKNFENDRWKLLTIFLKLYKGFLGILGLPLK
jgi:hypothetical protein